MRRALLALALGIAAVAAQASGYEKRPEVQAFVREMAARHGFVESELLFLFSRARRREPILQAIRPPEPGRARSWNDYRGLFVNDRLVQSGRAFAKKHADALARAEREYGVPAEIIVGIIGVETIYGQNTGSFRVIDALATLAFDFPAAHPRAADRAAFFRSELEQFLSLQSRLGADPLKPLGSYAGAMGLPQFMPSSRVKYAVDFDGDGVIDLSGSPADAIGSVASYFKAFGWKTGQPETYPVRFDAARLDRDALLAPDILPTFSVATFTAKGAVLEGDALQHNGPLALVELQNGDEPPSYVAGTENFYVITRYNWSSYYAMAVIELGRAVKAAMGR